MEIETHNLIVDFGKHSGERWTRVPVSYLQWLSNEVKGERGMIASAELKRRGTVVRKELELSGHAIDRASQITKEWQDEGVWSWLTTIANDALEHFPNQEEVKYRGFKFAFIHGENYPILKTIMKKD